MKKKLVLPCLRGLLGNWVFYSTLMSANEISSWIQPVKNIREAASLDEVLQRDLKERKRAIAKYLLRDNNRFFNSIIVGVFGGVPDWFEFDLSKTHKVIPSEQIEDIKQSIGLMVFTGTEQMFAIDGQHRVAGIQIATEDDKDKILTDDQFSVILVAHVDDKPGMKRTRKLFSDINKNAKPVAGGDKIKIDEEDLCSIVTRRLFANYSHFKKGKIISLTESEKLEKDDKIHFTNLLGLYNTNKQLKKLFRKKAKTQEWDEENVIVFQKIVEDFYDFSIKNIKEYNDYFIKKTLTIEKARIDNNYILFRPVGLKLIARLYAYYSQKERLDDFKVTVNSLGFIMPKSPFRYVLWNNGKMEAKESNQKLAFDLALYLLGELPKSQEKKLLENYREMLKNNEARLPAKV